MREIGSGWFVYALRDAAALTGHYSSPAEASRFFGQMAREISSACARGELECTPPLVAELPNISWEQVVSAPRRFVDVLELLLFFGSDIDALPSSGDEISLGAALRFLNHPQYAPPDNTTGVRAQGWYRGSGNDWIAVKVRDAQGEDVDLTVKRSGQSRPGTSFQRPSGLVPALHPGGTM